MLGGTPKRCLNRREKSEDDAKPHASATSVSDRPGACDIKDSARSSCRRVTNCKSVSPTTAWKTRWKWNGEKCAARATDARLRSPSRFATTWSIARLTRAT